MDRYIVGQNFFLNGLMYKNKGDLKNTAVLCQKALEVNPENRELKNFLPYES